MNKIERLFYLYNLFDNYLFLTKDEYIKKYNISGKTFIRDLKAFKYITKFIIQYNKFYNRYERIKL